MSGGWRKPKCTSGKAAFRTRGDARRAIERIATENLQAAVPAIAAPSRAYRCRCGAWHLTSQAQRTSGTKRLDGQTSRRPSRRSGRKRAQAPRALRHLSAAPEPVQPAEPPKPVRVWAGTDPITDERRAAWARNAEELARLNAEERLRPRRAAA